MPVTTARQNWLSKEWREAVATDASIQTAHPLAPQTVEQSLLISETDAQAEATRRQDLREVYRGRYQLVLPYNEDTMDLDLGDEITLTHPRFGHESGTQMVILGVAPNGRARTITLTVWG